jgi:hypothetical protein
MVPDVTVKRKTSLYNLSLGTLETVKVVFAETVFVKYMPKLQSILEAEIALV